MAKAEPIQVRFGRRLRELRTVRKWSQEELAFRSGLHRTYISSVERGQRNVSLEALEKLAGALGISLSQLLEGV